MHQQKLLRNSEKKQDKPVLKAAFIEESFYFGDDQVEVLTVNIKSKDELIGEIITLLQSPAKNVISSLQSGSGKLSGILKALSSIIIYSDTHTLLNLMLPN